MTCPDLDDMRDTLEAIELLDRQLVDCGGALARRIVSRAIAHLEASLRVHLTGRATWNALEGGDPL